MTIFSKFFGKRKANLTESDVLQEISAPNAELFLQQESPAMPLPEKNMQKDIFGLRDFYMEGRKAGYTTHSADGMELYLREIRASFRKALGEDMDVFRRNQAEAQMCLIQIGDMLPSKKQCLEFKIKLLSGKIDEYTLQQAISVDDEGLISSYVLDFTRGYRQGMNDYFEQSVFLNGH